MPTSVMCVCECNVVCVWYTCMLACATPPELFIPTICFSINLLICRLKEPKSKLCVSAAQQTMINSGSDCVYMCEPSLPVWVCTYVGVCLSNVNFHFAVHLFSSGRQCAILLISFLLYWCWFFVGCLLAFLLCVFLLLGRLEQSGPFKEGSSI